jgi:hypothetical protein
MTIRLLAAAELLLLFFQLGLGFTVSDPWIKKEWVDYYMKSADSMEPEFASSPLFLTLDFLLMLFLAGSLIGVIFCTTRARYYYLVAFLTSIPFLFLTPFYIMSSTLAFLDFISAVLSGGLLALLFTSSRKADQGAAATP